MKLQQVSKTYVTGAGEFPALKNINFDIYPGEFMGVVGRSGAGKSTLLNMLSGVSKVTDGEVIYCDPENGKEISIHTLSQNDLALWRGRNMGIVYQSFELMPMLDLVNNVMLPQDFSGLYQSNISPSQAIDLLTQVEIGEHAYKIPAHISGGQKQRVAIARSLANDPNIIIADEPTGSLDSKTSETILQIFEELVEQGKTVVMVTHDQNLKGRFTRTFEISDGEIIGESQKADYAAITLQNGLLHPNGNEHISFTGTDDEEELGPSDNEPINDEDSAIVLQDVIKTYVGPAGEFTALKNINLDFHYGEFVSIVGKSGSGKSTLLNMLTGIDHPTSGNVTINDTNVYGMTESQRALWRGRNLGIVFQFFQMLPTLTLLENIMLPMDYCKTYPARERKERAMELLDIVGLTDFARKLPSAVSTGQQQSAAIARSLANDPPIIVADEPTGNLDTKAANTIIELFRQQAEAGKTILIVTHDPGLTQHTDRTITLIDGRVVSRELEPELSVVH
ncbi:MAG: ATP-binding cassette domain-containing protein [Chloroflexota bacterium]